MRPTLVAAALALPLAAPGAASAVPELRHAVRAGPGPEVSSNWAGYAIAGKSASGAPIVFTDVTGTWTVPKATCTPGRRTFSAFWVGLGGFSRNSRALEQIGSEADCTIAGAATYALWYELVPSPPLAIHLKVAPGDRLTAAVVASGTNVTLQITNRTRHTRFTSRTTVAAADLTSAEWIVEAPSACDVAGSCRPLPLTNFGSVAFSAAAATGDGHAGTISDPAWTATAIELAEYGAGGVDARFIPLPATPTTGAVPGPLSADGRGFSVTWQPDVGG